MYYIYLPRDDTFNKNLINSENRNSEKTSKKKTNAEELANTLSNLSNDFSFGNDLSRKGVNKISAFDSEGEGLNEAVETVYLFAEMENIARKYDSVDPLILEKLRSSMNIDEIEDRLLGHLKKENLIKGINNNHFHELINKLRVYKGKSTDELMKEQENIKRKERELQEKIKEKEKLFSEVEGIKGDKFNNYGEWQTSDKEIDVENFFGEISLIEYRCKVKSAEIDELRSKADELYASLPERYRAESDHSVRARVLSCWDSHPPRSRSDSCGFQTS